MGLALVAHYFGRSEALVVWSVIDCAGVPAFVHGLDILTMRPWDEGAFFAMLWGRWQQAL
jgi:hypothetical protein